MANSNSTTDRKPTTSPNPSGITYVSLKTGNTLNSDTHFITLLHRRIPYLKEVSEMENCDVTLVFCPVVSRAGTDIEVAMNRIPDAPDSKSVLVVLHHTFDPNKIVPDSSRCVNRMNTLTVDCLFHEDKGLLECRKNKEALDRVQQFLQPLLKPLLINSNTQNLQGFFRRIFQKERTGDHIMKNNLLKIENGKVETEKKWIGMDEDEMNKLREKNKQLQDEKGEVEPQKKQIEEEMKKLREENKRLQGEKGEVEAQKKQIEEEMKKLREENKRLQGEKGEVEAQKKQIEEEMKKLREENKRLQGAINNKMETKKKQNDLEQYQPQKTTEDSQADVSTNQMRESTLDERQVTVIKTSDTFSSESCPKKAKKCFELSSPGPSRKVVESNPDQFYSRQIAGDRMSDQGDGGKDHGKERSRKYAENGGTELFMQHRQNDKVHEANPKHPSQKTGEI